MLGRESGPKGLGFTIYTLVSNLEMLKRQLSDTFAWIPLRPGQALSRPALNQFRERLGEILRS